MFFKKLSLFLSSFHSAKGLTSCSTNLRFVLEIFRAGEKKPVPYRMIYIAQYKSCGICGLICFALLPVENLKRKTKNLPF